MVKYTIHVVDGKNQCQVTVARTNNYGCRNEIKGTIIIDSKPESNFSATTLANRILRQFSPTVEDMTLITETIFNAKLRLEN